MRAVGGGGRVLFFHDSYPAVKGKTLNSSISEPNTLADRRCEVEKTKWNFLCLNGEKRGKNRRGDILQSLHRHPSLSWEACLPFCTINNIICTCPRLPAGCMPLCSRQGWATRAWRDTDAGPSGATGLASPRWDRAGILTDSSQGGGVETPGRTDYRGSNSFTTCPKKGACVWAVVPKGVAFVQCVQSSIWLFGLEQKSVQWATPFVFDKHSDSFIGISVEHSFSLGCLTVRSLMVRCISHTNTSQVPSLAASYAFSASQVDLYQCAKKKKALSWCNQRFWWGTSASNFNVKFLNI